jgi:hypothetical protein
MITIFNPPFCTIPAKGRPYFIISSTKVAAESIALLCFVVSFSYKESLVQKNQFECMLALIISNSSHLFSPLLPPLILGGLRVAVNIVCGLGLSFVYNLCTIPHVTSYSKF